MEMGSLWHGAAHSEHSWDLGPRWRNPSPEECGVWEDRGEDSSSHRGSPALQKRTVDSEFRVLETLGIPARFCCSYSVCGSRDMACRAVVGKAFSFLQSQASPVCRPCLLNPGSPLPGFSLPSFLPPPPPLFLRHLLILEKIAAEKYFWLQRVFWGHKVFLENLHAEIYVSFSSSVLS